jgi:hypothetical protein
VKNGGVGLKVKNVFLLNKEEAIVPYISTYIPIKGAGIYYLFFTKIVDSSPKNDNLLEVQ